MADPAVTIKVEGLEELQKAFKKFPKEWNKTARQALGPGLALLESGAKSEAPVDTARLQTSIGSEIMKGPGSTVVGKVGSNVIYASFQEYGTRYQPGKPYLRPTLKRHRAKVIQMFERGIAKTLKRMGL